MQRPVFLVMLGFALSIGDRARAVHLDVWVHKDIVNRVESGYFDVNAGVPITTEDRAFGYNFQEFDENPYYANNPGYFAQASGSPGYSNLPGGSIVGFNVLSDLMYWNGTDPVSFSPVPAGETIFTSLGSNSVTIGTGTGAQAGFTLGAIGTGSANGFLHVHVNSVINGGPGSPPPTDGIYIFQEQLTSNAPGVINSLPFWVVFNNNITEDQRGEAINFLYPNQWCGPLGGSYNTNGNWSGTIPLPGQIVPAPQSPNGQDAVANFLDNLYAASTITLDSPATVGTINFKSVPRYTLAGPSALTLQSSTTAQLNVNAGNHTISAPLVIASNTVVAAGTNSLDLQGAQFWNDNTRLTVQSGTLNYAIPAGNASTVGANVKLSIAFGATVNVGGAVNPFSDGTHKVGIANDSAGGLEVNAGNVVIGSLSGTGTTSVAAGAQLTADSIIQTALIIGGTSASHPIVTIDPTDSLGNPLPDTAPLPAGGATSGLAADLAASAIGDSDGVTQSFPHGLADRMGALPTKAFDGAGDALLDGSRALPEPSSFCLALTGLLTYHLVRRNRASRLEVSVSSKLSCYNSMPKFARRLPMMSQLRARSTSMIAFAVMFSGPLTFCLPANADNPHPDFAPRVENGHVVTGGIDDANNAFTPNLRAFDFVFGQDDPTQPYFDADPGFRAEPEPGFPTTGFTPGKHLHFDILSGNLYGLPSTLTFWDGTGSPHFGAVPGGETLTLDLAGGLADATAGNGNAFVPGYNIGTFDSTGDLHVHLGTFLHGSGGNNPADGIYMAILQLSTDMPGIGVSKPAFVLWDNGLGDGDQLAAAVDYVQATFVPEPSPLVLVGICSAAALFVAIAKRRSILPR